LRRIGPLSNVLWLELLPSVGQLITSANKGETTVTKPSHPILNPAPKTHAVDRYYDEEVGLAHRNHGMLLEGLRHDVTPAGMHYLLTHFDVPFVTEPQQWMLTIGGLVERPVELSLAELKMLPQVTQTVTLECAGNGRSLTDRRWPSQPWHHEAVGTSQWTGTLLKPLLERAGIRADVRDIVFTGADRGFDGGVEHDYGRSLTPQLAMADNILLVTAMNGQPLLPQHGAPLRLLVPGWYGMASVKWLNRIEAIDHAYQGFQQVGTYVYKQTQDDTGTPVTSIRVKSLLVPPGLPDWYTRRRLVERGPLMLFGRAWSGAGVAVTRVEVGIDGHYSDAVLDAQSGKYAWRGWRFPWDAHPGEHEVSCRATDANGDVQPLTQRFDRSGFGNNTVHRVPVTVR
jgi:DMSO/TMAO reductase YedYZ molybdopterin-dependent catalytic subunit